jgi:hypothetical protein
MKKYICSILLASLILLSISFASAALTGVTLVSPANNAVIKGTYTFNAAITGDSANSVTFRWWNASAGAWVTLCTNSTAGAGPFSCSYNTAGLPDGKNYIFNANATNGSVFVESNSTGITVDNTIPAVSLTSPSNGWNTTSSTVEFKYTPSDNLGSALSCSLIVDGSVKNTASVSSGSPKTVSVSGLDREGQSWYVRCNDSADNQGVSETRSFTIEEINYCDTGEHGSDLKLTLKKPASGSDYYPGEEITVEAKVTNEGSDSMEITVAAALYDLDDDDNLIDNDLTYDISEDGSKTFNLKLTVPANVDKSHDFAVYVKAYEDEDDECQEDSVSVDIKKQTHSVIVEKLNLSQATVGCGDIFNVIMEVGNAGTDDEENIKIEVSSDLFSTYARTIALDEGDESDQLNFQFAVPSNASTGNHNVNVKVSYDYDNGVYDESIEKSIVLNVAGGNCIISTQDVGFSVSQGSDAFIGSSFTTKVAVTNTGNVRTNYTVTASGYEGWATLGSISPSTLNLDAGSTGYAYISLNPSADVTGTNSFTVKVNFGSTTKEQVYSVELKKPSTPASGWDRFVFELQRNWQWFTLIVLLIVVIIILAIFLARQNARHRHYAFQPAEIRLRTAPSQQSRFDERKAKRKK